MTHPSGEHPPEGTRTSLFSLSLLPLLALDSRICNSFSLSFSHDFSLCVATMEPTESSMSSSLGKEPTTVIHLRHEPFEHGLLLIPCLIFSDAAQTLILLKQKLLESSSNHTFNPTKGSSRGRTRTPSPSWTNFSRFTMRGIWLRCFNFALNLLTKLTGMSEKALRDLNTILGTKRKNEGSSKACLTKPSVDNADENIEEWQKKKNEVEYIESENLNDLEDVDTCLK
ncbi:hypothetical protein CR513_44629, partial [Mucuna pruriens]